MRRYTGAPVRAGHRAVAPPFTVTLALLPLVAGPLLFAFAMLCAVGIAVLGDAVRGCGTRRGHPVSGRPAVPAFVGRRQPAVRLVCGAALAKRRLLLLDAPFGKLDAALREDVRRVVFEHARRLGLPTLMVTTPTTPAVAGWCSDDALGRHGLIMHTHTHTHTRTRPR